MEREKIRSLHIENFIWIVYFFIAISALVSNYYEEDYVKTHKVTDAKIFKNINLGVFIVAFFIYLYFVRLNYKNVSNLKKDASKKSILISNVNFIASLLFLLGGSLYLFTEASTHNDTDEIGF